MDNLTLALCIAIGTGVPWLIATYSETGARQLLGNSLLGLAGAALCAFAFSWLPPTQGLIALVTIGPVVTYLTIAAGQALKRAILSKLPRLRP